MESSSEAMRVHMSAAAQEQLVQEKSKMTVTSRGIVDVKGKGTSEHGVLCDSALLFFLARECGTTLIWKTNACFVFSVEFSQAPWRRSGLMIRWLQAVLMMT